MQIANADVPSQAASSVTADVICFVCNKAMNAGICLMDRYCHPSCFRCIKCEERILPLNVYCIQSIHASTNDLILHNNLGCHTTEFFKKTFIAQNISKSYSVRALTLSMYDEQFITLVSLQPLTHSLYRLATKSLASGKVTNIVASSKMDSVRSEDVKWCASCHRTVQESIFQGGQFYHPDCVECATCKKVAGNISCREWKILIARFARDLWRLVCSDMEITFIGAALNVLNVAKNVQNPFQPSGVFCFRKPNSVYAENVFSFKIFRSFRACKQKAYFEKCGKYTKH
ncbi:uncharacterized protein DEA37_0003027, partial [Paragonimus westermani]